MERGKRGLSGWRMTTMIGVLVLSAVGYLVCTIWVGHKEVWAAMVQLGAFGICLALILSLVNYSLRFVRWQHYLSLLGCPVPWKPSFRIYLAGFALTATPGRAGEALRGVFLKRYGVPYRRCLAALLSERVSDLLAVSALAIGGLWGFPGARLVWCILIGGMAVFLLILQKESWLKKLETLLDNVLPERFSSAADFFLETIIGFKSCFSFSALLYGMGLGILAWGAEAWAFDMILDFLHVDMPWWLSFFIYSFSLIVGALTFLPGGLGGTEVTMLELLHLSGVPLPKAVAATLVIRAATLWFSIVIGLAVFPFRHAIQEKP